MALENPSRPAALVVETARLRLRRLTTGDAPFILELYNDPSFLSYVGDKGIRSVGDARAYLRDGPIDSYGKHGFGAYRVELASGAVPIGICGLLQREFLPQPDLGFAFLPGHRSRGYATESAAAVIGDARARLQVERLFAIVHPANQASRAVLGKLGFAFERMIRMADGEPEVCLFALETGARAAPGAGSKREG